MHVIVAHQHTANQQWVDTCIGQGQFSAEFLAFCYCAKIEFACYLHDRCLLTLFHAELREVLFDVCREGDLVGVGEVAFAIDNNVICVLKDAATVVTEPVTNRVYINNSGCGAMSKAGCGDVLTGVIAAMLALRLEPFSAAAMGVYIHGLAGDYAKEKTSAYYVMAQDMIDSLRYI